MPADELRRVGQFENVRRLERLRDDQNLVIRRAGQAGKPVMMPLDLVRQDLRRAVLVAAGLDPLRTAKDIPPVLWDDGSSRLLVHLDQAEVDLGMGTAETGQDKIVCTFVTSSLKRPAGFVWASESRPRGPAAVVEIWGEALVALCWRALVEIAATGASSQGVDALGQQLIASTVLATTDGLLIVPMAAPTFMRVAGGR
jgi:hypothetical protein